MTTPISFKACRGVSLDEDGISSLGFFDPQTLDGNWDAFVTTADSPTGSFQARFSSLPLSAQPPTPLTYDLGPPLTTQHAVETLMAPVCPTLGELCTMCDEVGLHDDGPRSCPQTALSLIAANAPFLAATQRGCPALIRVYERVDAAQRSALVAHLLPKLAVLSMDAYANYMVQSIIEGSGAVLAARYVTQFFAGHLVQMSCDKFASNVVEKIIRMYGSDRVVNRLLLDELLLNAAAARRLVSDSYGNFVAQAVVSTVSTLAEIGTVSRILSPLLAHSPFATNIWAKVTKRRRELSLPLLEAAARHQGDLHSSSPPPAFAAPSHHHYHHYFSSPSPSIISAAAAAAATADSPPRTPLTPWSTAAQPAGAPAVPRDFSAGRYRHCPYSFAAPGVGAEGLGVVPRVQLSLQPKAPDADEQTQLNLG